MAKLRCLGAALVAGIIGCSGVPVTEAQVEQAVISSILLPFGRMFVSALLS